MPGFIVPMVGGYLADKAMDKLGVSDNVRDAISFATNPRGFVAGRVAGKIAEKVMEPKDYEGEPMYDEDMGVNFKKGGKVKTASSRADGCCKRGKTRGKIY